MGFFNREPPPRIVPRLANYSKFVLIAFYLSRAWLKDNCINNELMYESFEVYSLTSPRPIGLPLKAGDERMLQHDFLSSTRSRSFVFSASYSSSEIRIEARSAKRTAGEALKSVRDHRASRPPSDAVRVCHSDFRRPGWLTSRPPALACLREYSGPCLRPMAPIRPLPCTYLAAAAAALSCVLAK